MIKNGGLQLKSCTYNKQTYNYGKNKIKTNYW